jgi:hypothetical protein
MQHTRKLRWQTPVTGAPHLWERSRCGDPQPFRARRPLITIMRCWSGLDLVRGC